MIVLMEHGGEGMREKLIELLTTGKRRCWDRECTECEYDDIDPICQSKLIADFLIKNGVVIPVRCSECKYLEISGTWHDGISEECGFSNPYHFSRLFKEKTGLTPTEYLNQNRSLKL